MDKRMASKGGNRCRSKTLPRTDPPVENKPSPSPIPIPTVLYHFIPHNTPGIYQYPPMMPGDSPHIMSVQGVQLTCIQRHPRWNPLLIIWSASTCYCGWIFRNNNPYQIPSLSLFKYNLMKTSVRSWSYGTMCGGQILTSFVKPRPPTASALAVSPIDGNYRLINIFSLW